MSGSSIVAVERRQSPRSSRRARIGATSRSGSRGAAEERGGLLVGRGLGLDVDAVLGARSSSSYAARPGSIRYAASNVSSAGVERAAPSRRGRRARHRRAPRCSARADDDARRRSRRRRAARRPRARRGRDSVASSPSRHGTSSPSTTRRGRGREGLVELVDAVEQARNSKRRNISFSCERSGGASTSSAGSQSMSRSRRIVASTLELRAWSACSAIAFARAGRQLVDVLEDSLERAVRRRSAAPRSCRRFPGRRRCCRRGRPSGR